MLSVEQATAEKNKGLMGDRYHHHTGHWHRVESCQVTLIGEKDLRRSIKKGFHEYFHRRNLVISGIYSHELKGRRFCLGDAEFAYLKPRPPCGYLDQVSGKGASKALGKHWGICLSVTKSGQFTCHDEVVWLS